MRNTKAEHVRISHFECVRLLLFGADGLGQFQSNTGLAPVGARLGDRVLARGKIVGAEGFGEQLITQLLRLRTIDEKVERETGLQARFSHRQDPLEHIMRGTPNLYDMTDRRVLERVEGIRNEAAEKGYLSQQEEQFLRTVEYHTQQFQQNDFYKDKDDRGYLSRTSTVVDDIKKQLGIDWSYEGKRL